MGNSILNNLTANVLRTRFIFDIYISKFKYDIN